MMWVKWETEMGTDLVGSDIDINELDRVFRREELKGFSCLKYTYYYDDTIYNCLQVEELLTELSVIATFDLSELQSQELTALTKFITSLDQSHRRTALLKFYGE